MEHRQALKTNTVLDGKYRIEHVIGSGGFGITYKAFDIGLATPVAVKEYYPSQFGIRDASFSVRPRSDVDRDVFARLLSSFQREARTLARFEHPAIVRVISVFEEYGTAYMAMRYENGPSLKSWLRQLGGLPTQEELDRILAPLLDALAILHAADFLHRDIAPDNIIVRDDGSPVLLDFGASRRVMGEMSGALTGIIKHGYSPQEQYTNDSSLQGPWTDIYALGATLYEAVMGEPAPEATERMLRDNLKSLRDVVGDNYRPEFLDAIEHALALRPDQRPQSIAEWHADLFYGTNITLQPVRGSSSRPSQPRPDTPDGAAPSRVRSGGRSLPPAVRSGPIRARSAPRQASGPPVQVEPTPFAPSSSGRGLLIGGVTLLTAGVIILGVMFSNNVRIAGGAISPVPPPVQSGLTAVDADAERKRREAEQQKLDEQRRQQAEQKRLEDLRHQEAEQKKLDEQRRLQVEQKRLDDLRRQEAEQKKLDEQRRQQAEQKRLEDLRRQEAEQKRLADAQAQDNERKRQEAENEKRRQAEKEAERKRQDEERRQEAERQNPPPAQEPQQAATPAPALTKPERVALIRLVQTQLKQLNCHAAPVNGDADIADDGLERLAKAYKVGKTPEIDLETATREEFDSWLNWSKTLRGTICQIAQAPPPAPPKRVQPAAPPRPKFDAPQRQAPPSQPSTPRISPPSF